MGRRTNSDSQRIKELEAQVEALLAEVAALRKENAELRRENAELRRENAELRAEIERLTNDRGGGGPMPHPRRKKKPKPHRKPGRRPGEGFFNFKRMPEPNQPEVAVAAPAGCPHCGADADALQPHHDEVVTITKLPPREPVVTPYRVPVCECRACGRTVRGAHDDIAPDQSGATAHRLHAEVHALAHTLHYGAGVPVRKLPEVLAATTGVEVTQSAITQHALKQVAPGKPVAKAVEQLHDELVTATAIHTDDTGWKVTHAENPAAHVMAFESAGDPARDPRVTLFRIRPRHRSDEVLEVIPRDWPGTLITDRGPSYDAKALAGIAQQKCHAHIERNLAEAMMTQHPGARSLPRAIRRVLRDARDLWSSFRAGMLDERTLHARAGPLRDELSRLLAPRELRDPDNQRLVDGLGWHDDRGSLLRFLLDPDLSPTNNAAERALRPIVTGRKVSQCSKTWLGAFAHAAYVSLLRTIKRRSLAPIPTLTALFHGQPIPGR